MGHIFISHSSLDKAFVKELREALDSHGLSSWVDSRELLAGNELDPEIRKAIESARAFILVFSLKTFDSSWVKTELEHALEIQKTRRDYPVIPLLLEGTSPGMLKWIFPEEPLGIMVNSGPGAINEATPQLLAALGETLPDDPDPMKAIPEESMEELLLELSQPKITREDGKRRATATARLIYKPAAAEARPMESGTPFDFSAPIGPVEMEELRWYLERYAAWPTGTFKSRAEAVEKQLPEWGKLLYEQALPKDEAEDTLRAWSRTDEHAKRRFTVSMNKALKKNSSEEDKKEAAEAATLLLALPWELLHDKKGYLFQGTRATRVRRHLPNNESREVLATDPPIRILLISPRPEDEKAGYIDHRASALPLADALEQLGKMAELKTLHPPTFPALCEELTRAFQAKQPYHAVHFDGHGVYNPEVGLGGLCFEDPKDAQKLEKRRSQIIYAETLSEVLRDHRIPLVFLDACQTAQSENDPGASVAAALLNQEVSSVVAMTHSVLVATAKLFVESFYKTLVNGARIGDAMLAAQQKLRNDPYRMKVFGAGDLNMQDWFVPALFQKDKDPQLFKQIPSRKIKAIDKKVLKNRLGKLPPPPEHSFVGRSRDLLKLERLLFRENYAVVCGQGGEGKTTLAAELARWLTRSSQFERTVFVSVENHQEARSVLDQIGQQLVNKYSVSEYNGKELLGKALQPIERELENKKTLILLDNMETILPPPQTSGNSLNITAEGLDEPEMLEKLFRICEKLLEVGETRILFTTRENLPEPFHHPNRVLSLGRLEKADGVELVRQAMTNAGLTPEENDLGETQPEIEALVEAVNCHARSLALLAPQVQRFGVRRATKNLVELMKELDRKYPGNREKSLFASIELSLRRLPDDIRGKIPVLGLFHGGAHLSVAAMLLDMNEEEIPALANALIKTGLAEMREYGNLRLHPALCPYLQQKLETDALPDLRELWAYAMGQLADFLYQQKFEDARLAAVLTLLELPNLLELLSYTQSLGQPEATVDIATQLEGLLANLGRPRALKKVSAIREAEAQKLGEWSHAGFEAAKSQIERLLESGDFPQAVRDAQELLEKTPRAKAYPGVEYDGAIAFLLLGRTLRMGGASGEALKYLAESQTRFQKLAAQGNKSAARMAAVSLAEQGDCLRDLGRLDEAANIYEKNIEMAKQLDDQRQVAAVKVQLGYVRLEQKQHKEALEIYESVRQSFEALGEPLMVATAWHQIGMVHEADGNFNAAEEAYRKSLAIKTRQNNPAGEASSLLQLGNLYDKFGRLEEAATFYKQAADIYMEIQDQANEGRSRNNLAHTLIKLKRNDEARREILRAIECDKPYGHAAQPWKSWNILCDLEQAEGDQEAAARAREKAMELFLAYRRDGGENHNPGGRLCLEVEQAMRERQTEEITQTLTQLANNPETHPYLKTLIPPLQAILAGSRDPALADNPDLFYEDAVELKFLLEEIEKD